MVKPVIVSDPEVMTGTPCFRGTRVPFKNLIDYIEGGHSLGEFLEQFPTVTREMAVQALEEAKDSLSARIAGRFCWMSACHSTSGIAFLAT
jgi:uncharacterized protein (DUF433 family)